MDRRFLPELQEGAGAGVEDGALGGRGRDATKDAGVQVPDCYAGGAEDDIPRGLQEGSGMRSW